MAKSKATAGRRRKPPASETRERGTASLPCPRCGGPSEALKTFRGKSEMTVIRRRRCLKCVHRFNSLECVELRPEQEDAA